MNYKIVTSGKIEEVSLNELSRNLKSSSEVYELSDKEVYLGPISHKTLVFFATEFAEYAIKNYAKIKLPKAEICIHLSRKWLEDSNSVSNQELRAARNAAYDAAADFVYAAANAANAACVADVAANAAAVNAATNAATNANAANAAANAAGADKDKEFLRQGEFIIDFLKSGGHLFLV